MIATVVPAIRLRRDTSGWSYKIPPKISCLPGSLVVVPFRGKEVVGVIWDISETDKEATSSISQVLTANPLVRLPSRQIIEWLSQIGLCSLSTALYTWLPRSLRLWPYKAAVKKELERFNTFIPTASTSTALKQHAIAVPSQRPYQEIPLREKFGTSFAHLFADITPEAELHSWINIAIGEVRVGMGREGVLFAPWINLQQLTVIEPEDISYYHEQTPYLSLVPGFKHLAQFSSASLTYRTYLPTNIGEEMWQAPCQGNEHLASSLYIVDLSQYPLLAPELIEKIKATRQNGKQTLILYNAHDRLATSEDSKGSGRKLLPGVETVRKNLAKALGDSQLASDICLDTRVIFQVPHKNVGLVVALNLDHLLENPLFSDRLHGWSDLGHLFSYTSPLIIQTHQPDHPLLQALKNREWNTYLEQQIHEQREASLPPFNQQIVCSLKASPENLEEAKKVYRQLEQFLSQPWTLSYPFKSQWRKQEFIHLILSSSSSERVPTALRKTLVSLKRPWKIQSNPWHVL